MTQATLLPFPAEQCAPESSENRSAHESAAKPRSLQLASPVEAERRSPFLSALYRIADRKSEETPVNESCNQVTLLPPVTVPAETTEPRSTPSADLADPLSETQVLEEVTFDESERRQFPRRNGICLVTVCPAPEKQLSAPEQRIWLLHCSPHKGMMADVSINGVAFLLHKPLTPNTKVFIRMSNYRLGTSLDTSGTILRVLTDDNDQWRTICQFDHNLSDDQLETLSRQLCGDDLV